MTNKQEQGDRFEGISDSYGDLFTEVFAEQGLNYQEFEESVFENVSQLRPDYKNVAILDIGCGDGETSEPFAKAGCQNITGIDLNPVMLEAARVRLGESAKLVQMDATEMAFAPGEFPVIVCGAAIHNIPKEQRKLFWQELLRLSPDVFVAAEKITDPDPEKHLQNYISEVDAIKKVYGEIHGLKEAEQIWLDHYKYDEQEQLELTEFQEFIGEQYDLGVVFEMGMYKTVVARKKK